MLKPTKEPTCSECFNDESFEYVGKIKSIHLYKCKECDSELLTKNKIKS